MDETTSREKVLKSVRNALISKLDNPYQDVDFESPIYQALDDSLEMVFARELLNVSGKFVYCSDESEFVEILHSVVKENKWEKIHCLDEDLVKMLTAAGIPVGKGDMPADNFEAGLTKCEYLIARLGSVMVSSASAGGRRMNIYPVSHLVFAYTSQLVPDLKDALKAMKKKYEKDLPSMISVITGPSRTADIEKTLVMGAHGPKEIYVFMLDDQA